MYIVQYIHTYNQQKIKSFNLKFSFDKSTQMKYEVKEIIGTLTIITPNPKP